MRSPVVVAGKRGTQTDQTTAIVDVSTTASYTYQFCTTCIPEFKEKRVLGDDEQLAAAAAAAVHVETPCLLAGCAVDVGRAAAVTDGTMWRSQG